VGPWLLPFNSGHKIRSLARSILTPFLLGMGVMVEASWSGERPEARRPIMTLWYG